MVRPGTTYTARGERWMVVAVRPDGACTVVADDPLRAGTFDDEVPAARVPPAAIARALLADAERVRRRPAA
jgi:hypothetical protein